MKAKADQAKAQAQEAADKARKASAYAALWLFVSLLVGAFVASPRCHVRRSPTRSRLNIHRKTFMRSLLLLFLGVPIPIIILIALFSH